MRIYRNLRKWLAQLTWKQAFNGIITLFFLALFALFFDWLIINWLSGCCEGGICIPEWVYPQCKPHGGFHAE